MTPVNELKSKLGIVIDEMQTYLDRAAAENRNLSRREDASYNALLTRADNLYAEIDKARSLEATRQGSPPARVEPAARTYSHDSDERIPNIETMGRAQGSVLDGPATRKGRSTMQTSENAGRLLGPQERITDIMRRDGEISTGMDPARYSLTRFIRAKVTGDWGGAPLERDIRDTLSGDSGIGGGWTLPPVWVGPLLDLIRAQSVCVRAGAVTVPMSSRDVTFPRLATDPVPGWHGENQTITQSDPTFSAVRMSARTLACICRCSIELYDDTDQIGDAIFLSLAQALSLELDRAVMRGTGAGHEPMGIINTPGVTTTAISPSTFRADQMLDAAGRLWALNVEPTSLLWHPTLRLGFEKQRDGESNYVADNLPASIKGLTKLTSTQLATTTVITGDFSRLWIGMMTQGVRLDVSREEGSSFEKMQVAVRAYLRADSMLTHPQAFDYVSDAS